jgi:hypothetical protein
MHLETGASARPDNLRDSTWITVKIYMLQPSPCRRTAILLVDSTNIKGTNWITHFLEVQVDGTSSSSPTRSKNHSQENYPNLKLLYDIAITIILGGGLYPIIRNLFLRDLYTSTVVIAGRSFATRFYHIIQSHIISIPPF